MGEPRYRPRDFCREPARFGRILALEFPDPRQAGEQVEETASTRRAELDMVAFCNAAEWQHKHAYAIRHILKLRGMTIDAYATLIGESARRIGGVLRGETVMRLDDVVRAEHVLSSVYFVVRRNERLEMARIQRESLAEILAHNTSFESDPIQSPAKRFADSALRVTPEQIEANRRALRL